MAFSLGSFAGGVASGIDEGQEQRRRQMEMEATRRMNAAQAAAGSAGMSGGQQPPSPPMGQGVAPQGGGGGGPPQMLPQPGATPMPQAQAAPPQPKPPAPAPMGPAGQAPQTGPGAPAAAAKAPGMAQAMPGGTPAPGGQPAGPGAGGGGPLGNPQVVQTLQQNQTTLKSLYAAVLQARPDLRKDPQTAFQAVDDMIGQMKGVDQSDKDLMLQSNNILKLQLQQSLAAQRIAEQRYQHDTPSGTAELQHGDRQDAIKAGLQRVTMQQAGADRRTAMTDATRLQAEAIVQAGADHRTDEVTAQRQAALEAGLDMKEWQTQITAQLKEEGMSDAFISKIFSSQSSAAPSGQAPPPPSRGVPKPLPAPPRRGGPAGAPAGGDTPPVAGAKKAPDGKWYLPDPKRPGKYLQVS